MGTGKIVNLDHETDALNLPALFANCTCTNGVNLVIICAMRLTIEISAELQQQIQPYRDRIPELLERGVLDMLSEQQTHLYADEQALMQLLVSQPAPEQILALRPSPELQTRASDLLHQSKTGALSTKGEAELERILLLERMVRLAKAHAYKQTIRH